MDFAVIPSPVGPLKIEASGRYVISVRETAEPLCRPSSTLLSNAASQIEAYFDGTLTDFTFPVALSGTPFQMAVWNACRAIPYGRTLSYGDIARAIGRPHAVRAVGSALGHNPLLLVVPCHRVTASHTLGGFRLGLPAKSLLLSLEQNS